MKDLLTEWRKYVNEGPKEDMEARAAAADAGMDKQKTTSQPIVDCKSFPRKRGAHSGGTEADIIVVAHLVEMAYKKALPGGDDKAIEAVAAVHGQYCVTKFSETPDQLSFTFKNGVSMGVRPAVVKEHGARLAADYAKSGMKVPPGLVDPAAVSKAAGQAHHVATEQEPPVPGAAPAAGAFDFNKCMNDCSERIGGKTRRLDAKRIVACEKECNEAAAKVKKPDEPSTDPRTTEPASTVGTPTGAMGTSTPIEKLPGVPGKTVVKGSPRQPPVPGAAEEPTEEPTEEPAEEAKVDNDALSRSANRKNWEEVADKFDWETSSYRQRARIIRAAGGNPREKSPWRSWKPEIKRGVARWWKARQARRRAKR